ncbi:hypothetical protein HMPREF0591_4371, partial [Mycobacterium parascrofulaceum ATCC BAA-614]
RVGRRKRGARGQRLVAGAGRACGWGVWVRAGPDWMRTRRVWLG